jgi:REP element-mobilizing transposase RayT
MAYTKVWIHAVWGSKNHYPFLSKEMKSIVISHILQNAKTKGIYIKSIDGHTDHLHCLFGLNADTSISKTLQLIKGESAFWINKQKLTKSKFEWAEEYYASSVSESQLPYVMNYINNQEEHHKETTFIKEYESFITEAKLQCQG